MDFDPAPESVADEYRSLFDENEFDDQPGETEEQKIIQRRQKAKLAQRYRRGRLKAEIQEKDAIKEENNALALRNTELVKIAEATKAENTELRRKIDDSHEHIKSLQTSLHHVNKAFNSFCERMQHQAHHIGAVNMAPRGMRPALLSPISPDYANKRM